MYYSTIYIHDNSDQGQAYHIHLIGLTFPKSIIERIYQDFYTNIKPTRWGYAVPVTATTKDHVCMIEIASGQMPGRRGLLSIRNDIKLEPPHPSKPTLMIRPSPDGPQMDEVEKDEL